MPILTDERRLLGLAKEASRGTDRRMLESDFVRTLRASQDSNGCASQSNVLRGLLRSLVGENAEQIERLNFPELVKRLVRREFQRIDDVVKNADDEYFDLGRHALRCDFRIAGFGRIPVGPEHMEIDGIPRSLVYRGGPGQAVRFVRTCWRTGGRKPFYVLHLAHGIAPAAFLFVYSPQAQQTMFRNLAGCLEMNAECRGVLASSWWHDPQIDQVSPHLSYLRKGWVDNGAVLFRWGSNQDALGNGIANSPKRRQLYREGQYLPKSYTVIWPRHSLLAWAGTS